MRVCHQCKQAFEEPAPEAVLCERCCHLDDEEICFEALSLGEGSVECHWARKDHGEPHFWAGVIGDAQVRIEWRKTSDES